MENKAHALIAGLFTLLLLAGAIFIGLWLNRDQVQWVPYVIATKLSVPGLNPQASVRYRGLDVGKVDSIGFDPKEAGQILVRISVRPETPITQSTYATLGYQGVTGIAYVDLDDDGTRPTRMLSTQNHIARLELRPSILDRLQNRGLEILAQTEEVARRLNNMLEPGNQQAILSTFNNVSHAAQQLETIPKQLQPTLSQLPTLANHAQETMDSLAALSKEARTLTSNLNGVATRLQAPGGALDNLSAGVTQFGSMAAQLEYEVQTLTGDVRVSMRNLNQTLNNFNERPNSVLFGAPAPAPGPGEPGFTPPGR